MDVPEGTAWNSQQAIDIYLHSTLLLTENRHLVDRFSLVC